MYSALCAVRHRQYGDQTRRQGSGSNLSMMVNHYGGANMHIDFGRRFGDEQQFGARINLLAGREDIGIQNFSGYRSLMSGAFDWRVNDKLSFRFDVENYRKEVSEQAAIQAPTAVNGVITLPKITDARLNLAGEWAEIRCGSDQPPASRRLRDK